MGRFDIDRLLNDLGIPKDEDAVVAAPTRLKGDGAPAPPTETSHDDETKDHTEDADSQNTPAIDANSQNPVTDNIKTPDIVDSVETVSQVAEQLEGEINETVIHEDVQSTAKTTIKKESETNHQSAAFVRHDPTDTAPRPPDTDRKSTRLNSSHTDISRMPSSA